MACELELSRGGGRVLEDRVAVITGSASGIGRATAELFASAGAVVLAVDHDRAANAELVRSLREMGAAAEAIDLDLRDRVGLLGAAAEIRRRYPTIDVLFNNAGVFEAAALEAASDQHWEAMLDVNLRSAFMLTRELVPALRRSPVPSVINNASVDGLFGHPDAPVYSLAKAAVLAMTRALAYELGGDGIRINAIAPGGIATPMIDAVPKSVHEEVVRITPLRRLGTAREVAEVALFLAGNASSFITGEVITVDGGRNALTRGVK